MEGKQYHLVFAELDVLPVFVKEGSIIVQGDGKQNALEVDKRLQLHLFYGEDTQFEFTLYEDDGNTFAYEAGKYLKLNIMARCENGIVHLTVQKRGEFQPEWENLELIMHNHTAITVFENDIKLEHDGKGVYQILAYN